MHRMIAIALTSALLFTGSSAGFAAERRYSVTDFDRIQIDGPYRVALSTGRSSSARATGTADGLDHLTVEVQARTLRIRRSQSSWGGFPGQKDGPVQIEVTTQNLSGVTVTGPGTLTIDRAKGLRLDLTVSGSGRIEAGNLDADRLAVILTGSGGMTLGGKAKNARIEAHGSADVDAAELTAADAQIIGDTAGSIRLSVGRSANITALATGGIDILGKPACQVKALGTGEVRCGR